jgi:hypothetical protein
LALGAVGCQGRDIVAGVGDSTFVRTMADLRRLQNDSTLGDSARALARAATLTRHGVTAAQLERAARALAADPPRAQALFQAVSQAVDVSDTTTGAARAAAAAARAKNGGAPRRAAP